MTPHDFFLEYYPAAQQAMKDTGVLASITLAQAALESGWGEHAPGNNFFGIKAGHNWQGESQTLHTWECGNGPNDYANAIEVFAPGDPNHPQICEGKYAFKIPAIFRAYGTPTDSFADHGNFLKENPRYADCFGKDYKGFAQALQAAGYSTAPTYASELIQMIETHNLEACDE